MTSNARDCRTCDGRGWVVTDEDTANEAVQGTRACPACQPDHSWDADRARLLDLVGGKLPAIVAEWDDGDTRMRAVLDAAGSDNEVAIPADSGTLYVVLE